jgi:putative colanic acid biosynthesis acetyltransferase WcaF
VTEQQQFHYPRLGTYKGQGWDKGSKVKNALWMIVHGTVFTAWWFPRRLRPVVLRIFGAKIGKGVVIRHRVRVQWPWYLSIGDDSWVGEGSWLYSAGQITIGSDVCLSQGVFLCAGDHDFKSSDFRPRPGPITIHDGVWLAAEALVLREVTIGTGTVVGGRAIVTKDVPPGSVIRLGSVH